MEFVVYILYSQKYNKNYTGHSSNLIMRFASHNIFGRDSTAKFRPWVVVHVEFFEDKIMAMKKEKYYKSGRGAIKKAEMISEFLNRWAHTLP